MIGVTELAAQLGVEDHTCRRIVAACAAAVDVQLPGRGGATGWRIGPELARMAGVVAALWNHPTPATAGGSSVGLRRFAEVAVPVYTAPAEQGWLAVIVIGAAWDGFHVHVDVDDLADFLRAVAISCPDVVRLAPIPALPTCCPQCGRDVDAAGCPDHPPTRHPEKAS